MQTCSLHTNIYKLYSPDIPEKSKEEYEELCKLTVEKWEKLRESGVKDKQSQEIFGISRATYYRRKNFLNNNKVYNSKCPKTLFKQTRFGKDVYDLVLKIRTENPTYSRVKIAVIINRDHNIKISASSVGRILKKLNVPKSVSAPKIKRGRVFNKHAQPLKFKLYKDMEIGENVQIDHMTVTKNSITIKHFAGWERFSKYIHANCYCNATSNTAANFLREFILTVPYIIKSIQVDGGSEFMGEFEKVCAEFNIPLFVLPPATPKYNGGVERSNKTFREEFYDRADLTESTVTGIRRELLKFVDKYNTYRPHFSLKYLTPMEYLNPVLEASNLSHIL